MKTPGGASPSQRALELLCDWLGATTRPDSDKCFRAYYRFILSPATKVKRFVEIRYRFDEELTSEALQDLFLDHLERLAARQAYAEEVEQLLEPTWIGQCSTASRQELEQWAADVRRAVVDVMQVTQRERGAGLADLEARAQACNERIRILRDIGADYLMSLMKEHGINLAPTPTETDADVSEQATVGDQGAEGSETSSRHESTRASRTVSSGQARRLDRLFSHVKGLDADRQMAELLGMKSLEGTGLAANAAAKEVFCRLGNTLFKLARVRLPMLGQIYSIARFAAIDSVRNRSRMMSLDAIAEHSAGDEEGIGIGDIGQHASRGGFRAQLIDGDSNHVYFDDGSARRLLEDMELKIRQRSMKGFQDAGPASKIVETSKSEDSPLAGQAHRDFDTEVQQLSEAGLVLEEIANQLGVEREDVRAALGRIRGDFDVTVFELDTAGYTQEEVAEELRTTRDRVRSALNRIDDAIGRKRSSGAGNTGGQGVRK